MKSVCKTYHTINKPSKIEGVCDVCTGALIQRKDDHIDTVKTRLETYHKETEPLKDYYEAQGKLKLIDCPDSIDGTTKLVLEVLK